MTVSFEKAKQFFVRKSATNLQEQRSQIKQELRQKIDVALQSAKVLSPDVCLKEIRNKLSMIQNEYTTIEESFIVVEQRITCDQYGLGGSRCNTATLFQEPGEDASVTICVTDKGSLLHRNGEFWKMYRNLGDVYPIAYLSCM